MYGCESWTVKKAEHRKIDAFELWCWRRFLRVPWTARRSNQSILKEISPGCSLEGLMLKLKLQYFGHLMRRVDSLKKTLMLGGIGVRRRRGWQRMRWLDGITDSMDIVWVNSRSWWWTGRPGMLRFMGSQRVRHHWATELNWTVQIRDRTLRTAVLMVKMNEDVLLVLGLGVGHLPKYHNGTILSWSCLRSSRYKKETLTLLCLPENREQISHVKGTLPTSGGRRAPWSPQIVNSGWEASINQLLLI